MADKTLTEKTAEAEPAPEQGYTLIWDTGKSRVPGFGLRITAAGSRSFILNYRIHGKSRRTTIGTYPAWSVKAARERAAELLADAQRGDDPLVVKQRAREAQALTLSRYIDEHYSDQQKYRKSGEQTLRLLRKSFKSLQKKSIAGLTESDITRWRAATESKGFRFATVKRHFDALQGLLNYAANKGHIDANPLKRLKLEKPPTTEDEQLSAATARKMLSRAEVTALFEGLDAYNEWKRQQRRNSREHGKDHLPDLDRVPFAHVAVPWFRVAYFTGFRPGDLFGLRWEHVQFDRKRIRKVIEKTAAHNPAPQQFPLAPAALDTLKLWHGQQGKPETGYVFASERTGGRMDKHSMQKPWRHIKRLGALPDDLDIYSLRHNFGSQLIKAGVDLFAVSKLMAHSDIQTTITNYAHLAPDHAAAAVNKLPGASAAYPG